MTRLIDADAFKIIKVKTKVNGKTVFAEMMQKVLDTAPTIDAEPVRRGKWIKTEELQNCHDINGRETWGIKYMCESCGFKTIAIEGHFAQYKYCPQCGARMDSTGNEAELDKLRDQLNNRLDYIAELEMKCRDLAEELRKADFAVGLNRKVAKKAIQVVRNAEPVRHGKWILGKCNRCGEHAPFWSMATTYYESNYCPNCGARMDKE